MRHFYCLLVLLSSSFCTLAQAGLTIQGTRIIYDEARGETTVRISHTVGDTPVLMQTWLDDGTPNAKIGEQNLPFLLTPAVTRLDPGGAQTLRILRTRDELPQDRESLFYFNVLEVPPAAEDMEEASFIQFSMQARLKFFYRPKGLRPSPEAAPDLLRFTQEPASGVGQAGDGGIRLRIHNPTPYHITLQNLALLAGGAVLAEFDTQANLIPMVAPFGEEVVTLKAANGGSVPNTAVVRYGVINDQGGVNEKQKAPGS